MRTLRCVRFVLPLLTIATSLHAKVAPTPLENLYWASEIVAIGRDGRTFEKDGWRLAEFEIQQVIKGAVSANDTVYYLAEPTWTCDVSRAQPGSRALLFLHALEKVNPIKKDSAAALGPPPPYETDEGETVYRISASGAGRMDLDVDDRLSTFTAVVILPESLVNQSVPADEYATISSLPLGSLESYLRSLPERRPLERRPPESTKAEPLPPSMLRP